MGDTKPSNNTLHKTKHTKNSILSFQAGLDPVATSYLVHWTENTGIISDWIISNHITYNKKEPPNEAIV